MCVAGSDLDGRDRGTLYHKEEEGLEVGEDNVVMRYTTTLIRFQFPTYLSCESDRQSDWQLDNHRPSGQIREIPEH